MDSTSGVVRGAPSGAPCRLVVRKEKGSGEILQFVAGGLEMGQQGVVLAGAKCLKELASGLTELGLKPEMLLRNDRLIFLTAPECITHLFHPQEILRRGPLRRNGSVLRWVTDWSWAYANGIDSATILEFQRRVHDFVRTLTDLSLCTVYADGIGRGSLFAMLADHRRAARAGLRAYFPKFPS